MSYVDVEKGEGHILKMIIEMSFCLHIQDDIVTIYMNRSSRTAVYLTLERLVFFLRRQRLGGGGGVGFHRKSSNIAIGQFNALKSWPYTSKFTYDHPEQIETIFKSIGGFGKFWGAVERIRSKNPDFVRFQIF